jgi:hypothetical protein
VAATGKREPPKGLRNAGAPLTLLAESNAEDPARLVTDLPTRGGGPPRSVVTDLDVRGFAWG